MDLMSVAVNGALLVVIGAVVTWMGKDRFDAMDRRFEAVDRRFDVMDRRFDVMDRRFEALDAKLDDKVDGLGAAIRAEMRDGFRQLDAKIDRESGVLRHEMAIMRSDLTNVALAVGARTYPAGPEAHSG